MGFFIQVNDKGGKHFRKYTKDTLQMLFDVSPTAANFELMILVEAVVFLGYRTYCIVNKCEGDYDAFIKNKNESSFGKAIKKIYDLKIIGEPLFNKLNKYREMRNDIAHDLFKIKSIGTTPDARFSFREYSYTDALRGMFDIGVECIEDLAEIIIPSKDKWKEYLIHFTKGSPIEKR